MSVEAAPSSVSLFFLESFKTIFNAVFMFPGSFEQLILSDFSHLGINNPLAQ